MAIKKSRELYSFNIDVERETVKMVEIEREVEVEKEVEKQRKRKNKETGKMETYTEKVLTPVKEKRVTSEERTVTEKSPIKIVFRRPTRTQLEDGDMFYSVWLNKFIKMGLLTRSMLAKQHIDIGGTMDEEEKQFYSQMYVKLFEKQMSLQRFAIVGQDEMTAEQTEKRERLIADIGLIRKELTDFETVQASMFEHTADIKARNKTITWYLLHLTHYQYLEDETGGVTAMFPGDNYDEKYEAYKTKEDEEDEIFWSSVDKLSSIATIWYMSGVQQQEDFDTLLQEISDDVMLDEPGEEPAAAPEPEKTDS
jgi:hypothetical protein